MANSRNEKFIDNLYKEKEIHKEHRHKHVIQKLILSSSFYGISQISNEAVKFHSFLYVVPLIALVHDLYIFAEDYKVKRIGFFVRQLKSPSICCEEKCWEDEWLDKYRDRRAYWASFIYSTVITIFSAYTAYVLDIKSTDSEYFYGFCVWILFCSAAIITVFYYGKSLDEKKEVMKKHDLKKCI